MVDDHFQYDMCTTEDEDLDFYRSLYFDFKSYFGNVLCKVANKYLSAGKYTLYPGNIGVSVCLDNMLSIQMNG